MPTPDERLALAGELLEYYRRAANEAAALFPRQATTPPASTTPPTITTPTTTPTTSTTSSSSSSSSSSSDSTSSSDSSTSSSTTTDDTSTTPNQTTTTPPVSRTTAYTSARTTTASSSTISSYVTTRTTTNSNGDLVTTTEVVETAVPVVNANNNNSSSSVNTGAIVGGVVGGIAVIALLIGLFVWWRKKKRSDDFEANLFDPDRNVKRPMSTADPHSDLLTSAAVPEAARNITPYSYGNHQQAPSLNGSGPKTDQRLSAGWQPEGRPPSNYYAESSSEPQYHPPSGNAYPNPYGGGFMPQSLVPGAVAAGVGGGAYGAANLNRGPTVSSTTSSSYYPPAPYPPSHVPPTSPQSQYTQPYNNHSQAMPVPMPVPTPSPPNPRTAKEQEAFRRTHGSGKGGWAVSNRDASQGTSSPGPGSESVVVHQDGGRMNSQEEEDETSRDAEIPPTYESIRQDNQDGPTPRV